METLSVLIATSGGALMEVNITNLKAGEKVKLQYKVYFEGHCTNGNNSSKILVSVHPSLHVLGSVGDDSTLKIWDYENHKLIVTKVLDTECKPSSLKFSRSGLLAVGMDNGVFMLLSCRHAAWGIGLKTGPEIIVMFTTRETNSAIIWIEFSPSEEMVAVSYDNYRG